MSPKKKKTKKKPKKILLELTYKSLIFWVGGGFFLLIWTFILGVLVGRDYLSFELLQGKIAGIQENVGEKNASDSDLKKKLKEDPKFAFYEELSSKKEEAAKKNKPAKRIAPKPFKKKTQKKTEKKAAPKENTVKSVTQYVLQIGSFGDKTKATALVNRLKKRGHPAYFLLASVNGKIYYRVKCGPFKTEKKADELKKALAQKENIHGFVTRDKR